MNLPGYSASARKSGRTAAHPYVAVLVYTPADGSRGHTTVLRGLAFATRDEAVAAAQRKITAMEARPTYAYDENGRRYEVTPYSAG